MLWKMDLTDCLLLFHEVELPNDTFRKRLLDMWKSQADQPFHHLGYPLAVQEFLSQFLGGRINRLIKALLLPYGRQQFQFWMGNAVLSPIKIGLSKNHVACADHQFFRNPLDSFEPCQLHLACFIHYMGY